MESATNAGRGRVEVGIRDLRNNLSRYLDEVREGAEIVVTDRGKPVARLTGLDERRSRLQDLIDQGLATPPKNPAAPLPVPISGTGPISDLIAEQRR
ncbi:MAG TPA: type II toxin-antitoxin system prevent-host-death family antitoxin [Iamia sp.]|nr:type II toxin-antitoxin system prevent-host-death family antitoxin [Iamia sp.]